MSDGHAVVLGAGMGGLLAARVLSEHYDRVTVLERDQLPDTADVRRGVPQGGHVHGFQARGVQVVDQLFPRLVASLAQAGASSIDDLSELCFSIGGHLLCRRPQPIVPVLTATRPFLEQAVRERVATLPSVTIRAGVTASTVTSDRDADGGDVVNGVMVAPTDGGREDWLPADLVVDATGRGSRTPAWLERLGYERPQEERIAVRIRYVSQTVRLPHADYPARFVIVGRTPTRAGAAVFFCEQDRCVFTVVGGHTLDISTREEMLEAARGVLPDWAHAAVSAAEPLGPVSTHGHASNLRRRYDLLSRFPERIVVLGDAMCAFNPIYGQGMSVAAEQVLALRELLRSGTDQLGLRFARATATMTGNVWEMAAGSDLAYPEVAGEPSRKMRLVGRYLNAVLRVAERDPEVARRFMAVSGMVAGRGALFAPRVVIPVVATALIPRQVRSEPGSPLREVPVGAP